MRESCASPGCAVGFSQRRPVTIYRGVEGLRRGIDTIMWITWKQRLSELSWPPPFEEKVEIFYQRTLGWQLHIADLLANGGQPFEESFSVQPLRHSGFAVLQICLSYFETIGQYEQKKPTTKTSTEYFREGVRSVFPQLRARHGKDVERLLTRLYKGARCGLYHNSMTMPGIGLGPPSGDVPITYDARTNELAINPESLPRALKNHLEQFRARLLNPGNFDLRQNFERRFNEHNGIV